MKLRKQKKTTRSTKPHKNQAIRTERIAITIIETIIETKKSRMLESTDWLQ